MVPRNKLLGQFRTGPVSLPRKTGLEVEETGLSVGPARCASTLGGVAPPRKFVLRPSRGLLFQARCRGKKYSLVRDLERPRERSPADERIGFIPQRACEHSPPQVVKWTNTV